MLKSSRLFRAATAIAVPLVVLFATTGNHIIGV